MPEIIPNLVSTVIPIYNRPELLIQAVNCVLAQTYRPIEIIISDDGSTDETPQCAEKFVEEHPEIIKYVRNENRGPGPAREAGRLLATGEYIQYLDSDDYLHPGKFADQVETLQENLDCGIAYGITRLTDMDGKILQNPFKWTAKKIDFLFPGLLVDRWWCTHTPLYRRSVCDKIGSWADLRYSQDWEYDSRMGALNIKVVNCGTLVSDHRTHTGMRQTGHGKWLQPADRVRFFRALYQSAHQAGVKKNTPEMQHFSRWVFSHARILGNMGDAEAAQGLFDLACKASTKIDRNMRLISLLSRILGWKLTGKLCALKDSFSGNSSGKYTQKQSWMQ